MSIWGQRLFTNSNVIQTFPLFTDKYIDHATCTSLPNVKIIQKVMILNTCFWLRCLAWGHSCIVYPDKCISNLQALLRCSAFSQRICHSNCPYSFEIYQKSWARLLNFSHEAKVYHLTIFIFKCQIEKSIAQTIWNNFCYIDLLLLITIMFSSIII